MIYSSFQNIKLKLQFDTPECYNTTGNYIEKCEQIEQKANQYYTQKFINGTYGVCESCGKEITEERLLACPEAKTCLKCGN